VNPQAVNEPGFDVFTANRRAVLTITHTRSGLPVALVAIGAMLVGSVEWTAGKEKGRAVARGEELGFFAYGGSTVIAVFPKGRRSRRSSRSATRLGACLPLRKCGREDMARRMPESCRSTSC
jgi:phosphatidylserine decarboxylase